MQTTLLTSWLAVAVAGGVAGWGIYGPMPTESLGTGLVHLFLSIVFVVRRTHKISYTQQQVYQNQSFRSTSFACHTEYRTLHLARMSRLCNILVDIMYAACMMFQVGDARSSDCIVPALLTMMCVYRDWRVHGALAVLCSTHAARLSSRHTLFCLRVWASAWLAPCVSSLPAIHVWLSAWHLFGSDTTLSAVTAHSVVQAPIVVAFATGRLRARPSIVTSICYFIVFARDVFEQKIHYT